MERYKAYVLDWNPGNDSKPQPDQVSLRDGINRKRSMVEKDQGRVVQFRRLARSTNHTQALQLGIGRTLSSAKAPRQLSKLTLRRAIHFCLTGKQTNAWRARFQLSISKTSSRRTRATDVIPTQLESLSARDLETVTQSQDRSLGWTVQDLGVRSTLFFVLVLIFVPGQGVQTTSP